MGKKDKKTKGKRKSEKKAASYDLAEFEIFDTPTEMMEIGDAPITNDVDLSSATTNSKIDQQEQTNNEQQQEQQEQEVVEQEEVEEPKPKKPKLLQSERRALRAQRQLEKGVKTSMLDEEKTFSSFGVDNRIVLAIQKLKFTQPTLVQSAAIPLALRGKNILARAKTGTGKTAAYTIPIVNHILTAKQNDTEAKIRALILVPTVELCEQVKLHLDQLTFYCAKEVSTFVLKKKDLKADIPRLQEKPDVIVSTPGKIAAHLNSGSVQLKDSLEILVLDESDLLLSYGFEADIKAIINEIPKICQTFLMSATFSEEVEELKKLVLHNPVILKLHDAEETHGGNLSQFYINCPLPHDKYLYLYAMLKFNVTRGKTIIFVNDIDRAYRLKLFLAMFYINSAVLNSELPQNTRYHVVQEFNNEKFQYLIATEEGLRDDQDIKKEIKEEENSDEVKETKKQKKRKRKTEDQDFGVSRGIDFQKVAAVINFDMCDSVTSYLHRIGRTARAGSDGVAVSLIRHEEEQAIFTKIAKHQTKRGKEIKEYKFMDKEELSNFKYRVEDVMANITGKKIKTLRANEIKSEMLNSEKLKTYFLQNPNDLQALKHVRKNVKQRRSHLKDIPSYLQPKSSVKAPIQVNVKSKYNVAPTKSSNTNQAANNKKKTASTSKQPKKRPRMDPLDTFKY